MRALITGGAGFIGSHLADALLGQGDQVRVFDSLDPQIHGDGRRWPEYTSGDAERMQGDVRDRAAVARALRGIDIVFHLAAATGVGQSMYQIAKYFEVNVQGTANLLDVLVNEQQEVQKLVLASSRAVYGEGAYTCAACGPVHPPARSSSQLDRAAWEVDCPSCGGRLSPVPTSEMIQPNPGSMYAITKLCQEQMCSRFGEAYGMQVVILRLFNVYGPRQSLANPYTGIITTFANRLRDLQAPEVYEDGQMTRDFVYVSDVAQALVRAADKDAPSAGIYNVGSGQGVTVLELAERMCALLAPGACPWVSGRARIGDVRHCTASTARAGRELGFRAVTTLETGLASSCSWLVANQTDRSSIARNELEALGLLR